MLATPAHAPPARCLVHTALHAPLAHASAAPAPLTHCQQLLSHTANSQQFPAPRPPAGVPTFMSRLPVLGGLLRSTSVKAIQRLVEDIEMVVDRVGGEAGAGWGSMQ